MPLVVEKHCEKVFSITCFKNIKVVSHSLEIVCYTLDDILPVSIMYPNNSIFVRLLCAVDLISLVTLKEGCRNIMDWRWEQNLILYSFPLNSCFMNSINKRFRFSVTNKYLIQKTSTFTIKFILFQMTIIVIWDRI